MVQVLDLPAGNPEQPVSRMSSMICLSPHNTDHHLGHTGVIYTVDGYIGWLHMYYGGRSLDQQTVLLGILFQIRNFGSFSIMLGLVSVYSLILWLVYQ